MLLGDGARLFDNLGDAEVRLEQVRAVEAPGVTHLKYRVVSMNPYSSERPVASRSRSYRLVSGNGGSQDSRRMTQSS